jgi:hypothetical protein
MAVEFLSGARAPREISRTANPNPTSIRGTSGARVVGGYLQSNEKNSDLVGQQRYVTWSDMIANTSIIAAGARYYLNLLAKANWTLDPADDSAEAEQLAERTFNIIHNMRRPWSRVVRAAGMYRFYGFSVQEWTAKREEDGTFGLLDIATRPQNTIEQWDTEADGNVVGCTQKDPNSFEFIYLPRAKTIYVVDDALTDTPEGLGILRQLTQPAETLRELQRLETYGYEMDLQGVPIIRAPLAQIHANLNAGKITEEQADASTSALVGFLTDHARRPNMGLMLDSAVYAGTGEQQTPTANRQWDIETMTSGSADSAVAVATAIERLNREMARVMGVEELMLGSDGAGSFAMSKQKSDNFALMVDSSLGEIRWAMQNDVVKTLFRINGWPEDKMPKFRTEQIAYQDIEAIASTLQSMSAAGAMLAPDDPAINEIRAIMGLSPQKEIDLNLLVSMMVSNDPNEDMTDDNKSDGGS